MNIAEIDRKSDICMHCDSLVCVKSCLFLKFYKSNPKKYIKDFVGMYHAPRGLAPRKQLRKLNSCSLCGLCKEVCPENLDMGTVCGDFRKSLCSEGTMPYAYHDFWLRDMEQAANDEFFLARSQPGAEKCKYLFFPGCQMGASDPGYVAQSYSYLIEKLNNVGICLGCCGAPADWSGRADMLENTAGKFRKEWLGMGRPEVILACPTCHKMFDKHNEDVKVKSLWEIMDEFGPPEGFAHGKGAAIALYDPCSSRYLPEVQKSVRALLGKMGYLVEELDMSGRHAGCCSYGGLVSAANPKLAQEIRESRTSASSRDYVTYCTNCRDDFASIGKTTWHILDIISGCKRNISKPPPSLSERVENRRKVKARMLEEYWGETTESTAPDYERLNLALPAFAIKKMDNRLILAREVKQAIYYAETHNKKFIDAENGHSFAHLKIGRVTYWVEYEPAGDGFVVHDAYSHRVEILDERA